MDQLCSKCRRPLGGEPLATHALKTCPSFTSAATLRNLVRRFDGLSPRVLDLCPSWVPDADPWEYGQVTKSYHNMGRVCVHALTCWLGDLECVVEDYASLDAAPDPAWHVAGYSSLTIESLGVLVACNYEGKWVATSGLLGGASALKGRPEITEPVSPEVARVALGRVAEELAQRTQNHQKVSAAVAALLPLPVAAAVLWHWDPPTLRSMLAAAVAATDPPDPYL